MSPGDISTHLLADWIPSVPAPVSSSLIGWPPMLLDPVNMGGNQVLTLSAILRQSERQWKSVVSWMLGIASARHFLASEGYRWVAPLSAFYPNNVQQVDLSTWNFSFPRSSVSVASLPGSRTRLRPDYLALRPSGRTYKWAVAEAKGSQIPMTNLSVCPVTWSNQVRNVIVSLRGSQVNIPRHLVIATRVNPNARRQIGRRLQVRAWNRREQKVSPFPVHAAVDVAAAHLFGLFKGVGLRENARAIALSVQARTTMYDNQLFASTKEDANVARDRADRELHEASRATTSAGSEQIASRTLAQIQTELGTIIVDVAEPLIQFARKLQQADNFESAASALHEVDAELDDWQASVRSIQREVNSTILPIGVRLHFPRDFNRH